MTKFSSTKIKRKVAQLAPLVVALVLALAIMSPHAQSSTSTPITGWMWSDTIGWINLNCQTDSSCGSNPWGLNLDSGGTVSGFAWSDIIGWISAVPGGCGAVPTFSNGTFSGFLKATVADGNGWDGCISLSGTSPDYGVTTGTVCTNDSNKCDPSKIGGAWGSNVVGWLGAGLSASCTATPITCSDTTHQNAYLDSSCTPHDPTPCDSGFVCVDLTGCTKPTIVGCVSVGVDVRSDCVNANTIGRVGIGKTATLYWRVTNVDTCTLSGLGVSKTSDSSGGVSSDTETTPVITGNTSYTLTCYIGGVVAGTYNATVGLQPVYQER